MEGILILRQHLDRRLLELQSPRFWPSAYGGHHFASSCSAASHLLSYSPQRPSINAVGRCLHDLSQLREYDHSAGYGYAWYRLCRLYLSLHRHSDDVYLDPWSKRSHW